MFNFKTNHGTIHAGENIIRKIVIKGIEQYDGRVIPYNMNSKLSVFARMKNIDTITPNINAIKIIREEDSDRYEIMIPIVVRFGTSITEVTNGLIDYVYEYTQLIVQAKPAKITVKVTGTLSKSLVKRDIEVSR